MLSKKKFLTPLLLSLLAASIYDSNTRIVSENFTIASQHLSHDFNGFTIAHLSDMHARSFGKGARRLISAVSAANPDIIVITGDLIEHNWQLSKIKPQLIALLQIAPVFYASGNHEWSTNESYALFDLMDSIGVTALRNDFRSIHRNASTIIIAGIDDEHSPHNLKKPAQLISEIRTLYPSAFTILLSHRPDNFPAFASLGFNAVLSGHLHGGLMRLPLLGGVFGPGGRWFPQYTDSFYTKLDSTLIVSKGLAGVGLAPRIFNPPHLPIISLTPTNN